jgi:hypothetical protein
MHYGSIWTHDKLSTEDRTRVAACLIEGNSIRATARMAGVARNTVNKLLVDLGTACLEYQDRTLVNLPFKRNQCDEVWSFVGAKEKNASAESGRKDGATFGHGAPWTRFPSWSLAGPSASVPRVPRTTSFTISRPGALILKTGMGECAAHENGGGAR